MYTESPFCNMMSCSLSPCFRTGHRLTVRKGSPSRLTIMLDKSALSLTPPPAAKTLERRKSIWLAFALLEDVEAAADPPLASEEELAPPPELTEFCNMPGRIT